MTCSGTFGSGMEYAEFVDLSRLGAVVTKGVANVPWPGNPTPRVAEVYGGMLNAIGLQNPGIDVFCERDIPFLQKYDTKIIVNVCGRTTEDYCEVVDRLAEQPVDMLEINISCPNVKHGGIAFGQDPKAVEEMCIRDSYERYMEIYQVLAAAGRADVGQEYLKKALDIDKDKNKNRLEKGKVYYYMEQYDKAKTELEQADSSQNPEVTLFLAKTYEALGDPSYAQNLYRQYLDQDGSDGSIYNLIAVSQMKAGDYEGGLATIQEGLQKASSGKQELYRNEIAAYEYLLNFSEAKTKMEAYLAAYPEDSEAAREYTFLKSRSK